METITGDLSKLSVEPDNYDVNKLPLSIQTVVSNDDLLSEILLRLPAISLLLFKSISKRWLSLIKDTKFIKRQSQIPKIDPPSGLFIMRVHNSYQFDFGCYGRYDFVRFDTRIPVRRYQFETTFEILCEAGIHAFVEQSCNGLLLCHDRAYNKYYVYNPSINLFKLLPPPHISPSRSCYMKMAFDPTKSPHYKVVYASSIIDEDDAIDEDDEDDAIDEDDEDDAIDEDDAVFSIQIQTYSSEIGDWIIVPINPLPCKCFSGFQNGIYWNDGIHWLTDSYPRYLHYKLDFVNEHPILTNIQLPGTLDEVDRPSDRKLFESRGCLLLLGMAKTHSLHLNIYEMRNEHSEWSFKYFVNLCDIITPISGRWRMSFGVLCIALGEREEDSCMVIGFGKKAFQYNIVLKTSRELSELNLDFRASCFLFTASFASV